MSTQIPLLIEMQKLDDIISGLEIQKKQLPQQLDNLKLSLANATEDLDKTEKLLEQNILTQKSKENEIKSNKDLKLKYGHQLDTIKTNKEYKALNSQIVKLDEKNSEIEEEILLVMEEENYLKKQRDEQRKLKKLADENLKANENILHQEIVEVEKNITLSKEKRTEIGKQLPMSLVKKYVQLIQHKNKKAVVFSSNNACSGCGFHIRPQILIELNDQNKIIYCENCGRILVKETNY